jgi:hypothetical protein
MENNFRAILKAHTSKLLEAKRILEEQSQNQMDKSWR